MESFSKMRARRVLLLVAGSLLAMLLIVMVILPSFAQAKKYSGPGIQGNLFALEVAKAQWWDSHRGGSEWPAKEDLLPYLLQGRPAKPFDQVIRPRNREIYLINKTGAPVCAIELKSERIYTLEPSRAARIQEFK